MSGSKKYTLSCSVNITIVDKKTEEYYVMTPKRYSMKMMKILQTKIFESVDSYTKGIVEYAPKKMQSYIHSILPRFDISTRKLNVDVEAKEKLTKEQLDKVKDYVGGQLSDGWGEGFEQIPFHATKKNDYQMFCNYKTLQYI